MAALIGVAIFAWRQRAAPVEIHSLAILGLENRSGDASQDYFADGLTNALAADLGRLNGLRVIPPATTLTYRGTKKPLPEIGKELNADVLLDGTVSRVGNRVEIKTRLVNARSGRDLWSHTYDSAAADLPASQNQIERDIAAQVHASAPDRARLIDTRKLDPRAYDLYLRGSYHLGRVTAQDADQAIALYEQAAAIAPDFAPIQANLASAYAQKSFFFAPDDQQLEGARLRRHREGVRARPQFRRSPPGARPTPVAAIARVSAPRRAGRIPPGGGRAAEPGGRMVEYRGGPDSRRAFGRGAGGIAQSRGDQSQRIESVLALHGSVSVSRQASVVTR